MRRKSILVSATAIVVVLGLCGSTLIADVNEGLISHWMFDEGSGTIAYDSAGDNDGTVYGAAWTTGQLGGALNFDGYNDYLDMIYPGPLGNSPRTITAWAKTSSSSKQIIFSYGGTSVQSGSTIRVGLSAFGCQGVTFDVSYGVITYSATVADGKWHHYAYIVPDKVNAAIGDVELYQDGVLLDNVCASAHSSVINTLPTYAIDIGRYTSDRTQYFNGTIGDVRVYDRALSAGEIEELYQLVWPEVVSLEISGPNEVAENFSAGYKAIAYYDDDSTRDVTDSALWVIEPNMYASIEAGVLTTKDIVNDQSATILAGYTVGDVTVIAEKTIEILAICPTGTTLSFDGVDDYVQVPYTEDFQVSVLTMMGWVYPTQDLALRSMNAAIASRGEDVVTDRSHFRLGVRCADSPWGNGVEVGYETDNDDDYVYSTDWYPPIGGWTHIAATRAGDGVITIYANGAVIGQWDSTPTPASNCYQDLTIGAGRDNQSGNVTEVGFFPGRIDDVRIYDRVLSAEEVWANMHNRLTGDELGLVGYWDFDEGQGQIVYDVSGNDNNGQLGSTPDVDAGDPAWIESDVPIGRCTPYLIATGSIKDALKHKKASLQELQAALDKESTAYEALEELLESGDYGDLKKGDIVTAKQRIHSAIQHQEQAINTLEKSINQLEDALIALGYETEYLVP